MEIKMPRLGNTMQIGEVTEWFVKVGEEVEAGAELCEIASEKLESVITAEHNCTVKEILVEEGDEAEVGATLAILEI